MKPLQLTQADRLRQIHSEIMGAAKMVLEKAIEAGGILLEVKAGLPHGDFTAWVETNAGFSIRTAQRYMKIFEHREELKNDSVSLLADAHKMLENPIMELKRESIKQRNKKLAEQIAYAKENPPVSGTVEYGKGGYGWDCKFIITGHMNGFPLIHTECIDPEYHRLKSGEASYEITRRVHEAVAGLESAARALQQIMKECGGITDGMYDLDWNEGVKYLKPELEKALSDLRTVVSSMEPQINESEIPERQSQNEKQRSGHYGFRPGWTSWGAEALKVAGGAR